MKNENIPAEIKSKSLKEAREEINDILNKLESKDADLTGSLDDYKRLIQLNKHIDLLFKEIVRHHSVRHQVSSLPWSGRPWPLLQLDVLHGERSSARALPCS